MVEVNKKKETSNTIYDALAVLSRPIKIDSEQIYGLLYNIEEENQLNKLTACGLEPYINFLVAIERWEKNGGCVTDNCESWNIPDWPNTIKCDTPFQRVVCHLMDGEVKIIRHEFDHPLEWDESEVDNLEPRLVISQSLIDRYTKDIKHDKQNNHSEV